MREAYAALHTSVCLLLGNLYVSSSRLAGKPVLQRGVMPTLVWGADGPKVPPPLLVAGCCSTCLLEPPLSFAGRSGRL